MQGLLGQAVMLRIEGMEGWVGTLSRPHLAESNKPSHLSVLILITILICCYLQLESWIC